MKIDVLYDIDKPGKAPVTNLKKLIEENKILAFRRASGWVRIGIDPMRGDGGDYGGPERRNIRQKGSDEPEKGAHLCMLPPAKPPLRD